MRERGPYQDNQYRRFLDPNYNPKDDPNSPDYEPDYVTRTTHEDRHHGQVHGDSWVTREPVTRERLTESGHRRQEALRRAEQASNQATLDDLDQRLKALDHRMQTEVLAHRKPRDTSKLRTDNPYIHLDPVRLRDKIQQVQRELRNIARAEDTKMFAFLTRNRFINRETDRERDLNKQLDQLLAAQQTHQHDRLRADYEQTLNTRAQDITTERQRLLDQAYQAEIRSGKRRF